MNASTFNPTPVTTQEQEWTQEVMEQLIPGFLLYASEGVLLILTNAPIIATVFRHRYLRAQKQYLIVAGLALTDFLNGVAAVTAGIGRISLIGAGRAHILRTGWECALAPWNVFWLWVNPLVGVMMATVSVDRLLAVATPLSYRSFTVSYAYGMVGATFLYVWASTAYGLWLTYECNTVKKYPSICYTIWSTHSSFTTYQYSMRVGGAAASVIICIVVYIVVTIRRGFHRVCMKNRTATISMTAQGRTTKSTRATLSQNAERQLWRNQRRLTGTVGISTIFTLIFFVVPYGAEMWAQRNNKDLTYIVPAVFVLNNINAMLNFFIYTFRHKDLRVGFRHLFSRNEVTPQMLL